jgi:hypothetical protein
VRGDELTGPVPNAAAATHPNRNGCAIRFSQTRFPRRAPRRTPATRAGRPPRSTTEPDDAAWCPRPRCRPLQLPRRLPAVQQHSCAPRRQRRPAPGDAVLPAAEYQNAPTALRAATGLHGGRSAGRGSRHSHPASPTNRSDHSPQVRPASRPLATLGGQQSRICRLRQRVTHAPRGLRIRRGPRVASGGGPGRAWKRRHKEGDRP